MTKLLVLLFIYLLSFGISVFTMIVGWGVSPSNWPAIILGWIGLTVIAGASAMIGRK